ncbi:MAG: glycosyltransferase, partial [Terriglobales bacterium]
AGAAVFVLPSRYEPFGLGALEAALSGCALLLNDIPSLREVWGRAAAYFGGGSRELAAALAALAASPRRRRALADAAARRARACYGATRMAEQYAGMYARLMGRAGERALSDAGATAPSLPARPLAARNSPALARNPM